MCPRSHDTAGLPSRDRDILRRLAEQKIAIAHDPINAERRQAWQALDAGGESRVMLLVERGGVRDALRPAFAGEITCTDPWARSLEYGLRDEIYHFEGCAHPE